MSTKPAPTDPAAELTEAKARHAELERQIADAARAALIRKVLAEDVFAPADVRAVVEAVLLGLPIDDLREIFATRRTIVVADDRKERLGFFVSLQPAANGLIFLSVNGTADRLRELLSHELGHAFHDHQISAEKTVAACEAEAELWSAKHGFRPIEPRYRIVAGRLVQMA